MVLNVSDPNYERQVARALQEYLDTGADVRFAWAPGDEGVRLVVELCESEAFEQILEAVVAARR